MYGSLFWIEWLDRLDRVLTATRGDVAALARAVSPRGLEALERSKRQLSALTNDLRLLDRDVLAAADAPGADAPGAAAPAQTNGADRLQQALDTAVFQLGTVSAEGPGVAPIPGRLLAAIDAALRDSCYEAAMLVAPTRRRA
jgi:hypothetical protein